MAMMQNLWTSRQYLYWDLEAVNYMECPPVLKTNGEEILTLEKCIYCLGTLKKSWFIDGEVEPCIFVHRNNKGTVIIALYVENNMMIGDTAAINEAMLDGP